VFGSGEDQKLKELYKRLDPRFRPVRPIYVCRACGAGYWDRDRQCTRCHSLTRKRRSWPWPAFDVVGPDRIRCGCGHEWRLRRALNFNSLCPRCRGRLLVANPPATPRRRRASEPKKDDGQEWWEDDWGILGDIKERLEKNPIVVREKYNKR